MPFLRWQALRRKSASSSAVLDTVTGVVDISIKKARDTRIIAQAIGLPGKSVLYFSHRIGSGFSSGEGIGRYTRVVHEAKSKCLEIGMTSILEKRMLH